MTNRTPAVLRILARTAVVPTCGLSSSAAAKSSGEGSSTSASTSHSSVTRTIHPRKSSGGWKNLDIVSMPCEAVEAFLADDGIGQERGEHLALDATEGVER